MFKLKLLRILLLNSIVRLFLGLVVLRQNEIGGPLCLINEDRVWFKSSQLAVLPISYSLLFNKVLLQCIVILFSNFTNPMKY